MKVIFLILIGFSIFIDAGSIAGSFSRSNGVVSDSSTNLEWQDDYSDNNNSIKQTSWQSAIDYCENLNLDGKSDWRLPNINELTSLVDDTKDNPSLNEMFQNIYSSYYWSSTSNSNTNESSWIVDFTSGIQYNNGEFEGSKGTTHYVRCVRAGQ